MSNGRVARTRGRIFTRARVGLLATVGAMIVTWATLAVTAITADAATGPPTVTSVNPNEGGSGGGQIIHIHGTHFEEVQTVTIGGLSLTKKEHLTKGSYRVAHEPTEIEAETPIHEHGKTIVVVTNPAGHSSETEEPGVNVYTFLASVFRNESVIGRTPVPAIGFGQMELNSPQLRATVECGNLGAGAGSNEGTPTEMHGKVLAWSATSHFPEAEASELSSRCRFVVQGHEENEPSSSTAWLTTEAPLHEVVQPGLVCTEKSKRSLSECPNSSEREEISVVTQVTREPSTLPWNVGFTEREGKSRIEIGLPSECKNLSGSERTELSRCPRQSEREAAKSAAGCNVPPTPAPEGCVRVQLVSTDLLLDRVLEGHLEPHNVNGATNGLSPSTWEFEGTPRGESALHSGSETGEEWSVLGSLKILGYEGEELLTVK